MRIPGKFGFDRLYAGLLVGDDAAGTLLDGILPVAGVRAAMRWRCWAKLDQLLGELRRAREGFSLPRPLAAWSDWLLDLIDAMFQADPRDEDERGKAFDALRRIVAGLAEQGMDSRYDEVLSWSVVREAVRGTLNEISERQPFCSVA